MEHILSLANQIIEHDEISLSDKLLRICNLINDTAPKYTWVGFYFMEDETRILHLGPYVGAETEHLQIPYGRGICGQVAHSGSTYLADNVGEEQNYIACSAEVRSELVIPIYDDELLVAQLDIDSNEVAAFSKQEQQVLEELCYSIGAQLGSDMHYEYLHEK
ncbi:MAG: GAF domain-containing protein [Owenweeksia sp.]|nr:GAF domain-containing protein [Owenweeksia sp.]